MKKTLFNLLISSTVILLITSCQKTIDKPFVNSEEISSANKSNAKGKDKKVYVSNLDELYAAVNDPGNSGAEINLAPGTYVLSASYPNGGRLELQTDMSLRGQPAQVDAVLIDQSALPNASFRLSPTVTVAPIRIGRGTNSIEWLSVKGGSVAANPLGAIESDLIGTATNVTISHVNVDCNGGRIGILFRNRLQEHADRVINATLEFTEISNAITNPNSPGAGLALQNRISGAQINLAMNSNYIHGCRVGLLHFNGGLGNNIENCSVDITSHNDRIEGNGCGIDLGGGSANAPLFSNNNTATAKMFSSTIKGNGLAQFPPNNEAHFGGMDVSGGFGSNGASNNIAIIKLFGCDISDNNGTDIYAYGAFSPAAVIAGTNNRLNLYLYGLSANAIVDAHASIPAEPAGTNVVNVYR